MKLLFKQICCIAILLQLMSCTGTSNSESTMKEKVILEVTTFNINSDVDALDFATRDAKVESDFTSKQPGFVKRQSGVDDNGNYLVAVYWKSIADADNSMNKFMKDASVADYGKMINASTMKMSRYSMDKAFEADGSQFVEVMSFNVKPDTDMKQFKATNYKVETDFTGKRKGFSQRLIGTNEKGRQIVVVYWDTKANSDASIGPFMQAPISKEFMGMMESTSIEMGRYRLLDADPTLRDKGHAILRSIETGDEKALAFINSTNYKNHNLTAPDGLEGFKMVLSSAPVGTFKADVIRSFQDGDYAFYHMKYDFGGNMAAFDVFRFENGLVVEHWDNLLPVQPANPSGRTQFDGATEITDLDKTEANKAKVKDFIETVLLKGEMDKITNYINPEKYLQHNPAVADGLDGFGAAMKYFAENNMVMEYDNLHKVIGQGNFVLSMSEGKFGKKVHTAFYDLFRLEDGLIVEHWDVIATIPPKSEWKNNNGKFYN